MPPVTSFERKKQGWTIKLDIREQEDVAAYDEKEAVENVKTCADWVLEVFSKPNKYERRIITHAGIPLLTPSIKTLYSNVIFHSSRHYYCAGSGGYGGGKTFWLPRSTTNPELSKDARTCDLLCDPCGIMAHELQHGVGGHAEFGDYLRDLIAIYARTSDPHYSEDERCDMEVYHTVARSLEGCHSSFKGRTTEKRVLRTARDQMCAFQTRFPQQFRALCRKWGLPEGQIDSLLSCACK